MAADSTLVQGAGLVARSKGVGKLAGAKAFTDTANYLSKGIGKVVQKRNKEFNAIMNNQLNKDGLSDEQYDDLYEELQRKRGEYVYLNKKFRSKAEQEIIQLSDKVATNENENGVMADNLTNMDPTNDFVNTAAADVIVGVVDGSNKGVDDGSGNTVWDVPVDGIRDFLDQNNISYFNEDFVAADDSDISFVNRRDGYFVPGSGSKYSERKDQRMKGGIFKTVQLTKDQLISLAEYQSADPSVKSNLNQYVQSLAQKAMNLKPGDNYSFNYKGEYQNMSEQFVVNGNWKQLSETALAGDRIFKNDFIEALQTHNYEELGIGTFGYVGAEPGYGSLKKEEVLTQDPTPGDGPVVDGKKTNKITLEDATFLYKKVYEDPALLKPALSHYFTRYAERSFKNNINIAQLTGELDSYLTNAPFMRGEAEENLRSSVITGLQNPEGDITIDEEYRAEEGL